MAKDRKTPGVYIEEINAFPNSVVPIPTAVPAFVGYTEFAMQGNRPIGNQPTKIASLMEFQDWFGEGNPTQFDLAPLEDEPIDDADMVIYDEKEKKFVGYKLTKSESSKLFYLYDAIRFFYANGGGDAYILSIGDYTSTISGQDLEAGVELLKDELEPTMLVIPDAMALGDVDAASTLQMAMVQHCMEMQSRVAILDIYEGYKGFNDRNDDGKNVIELFREKLAITKNINYGVAYYPWINTNITEKQDIYFNRISDLSVLKTLLSNSLVEPSKYSKVLSQLDTPPTDENEIINLNNQMTTLIPAYKEVINALSKKINLLPPAAAMAGVFTRIDNETGVWKAPANTGVNNLISPSVQISSKQQEDLNVPIDGKAINAIRTLPGRGTLVWGARTLDGNSQDWRYINVRRVLIFLEQSIKAAAEAFVFEPNNPTTWTAVRSMIENFLTNQWSAGALFGNKPAEAFSVAVGLGQTMTTNDILDGYMRVTVRVAVVRPAEYIVITFQQQMPGAS